MSGVLQRHGAVEAPTVAVGRRQGVSRGTATRAGAHAPVHTDGASVTELSVGGNQTVVKKQGSTLLAYSTIGLLASVGFLES